MSEPLPRGERVDYTPPPPPSHVSLGGAHVLVRPLEPGPDAGPLYEASHPPAGDPDLWTYLPDGPYEDPADLERFLQWASASQDPLYFALIPDPGRRPAGIASYLRITPHFGVLEIGHIWFGSGLVDTTAATEAIFLLARHAFDELSYRRLEWKCDALNAASRRAAQRFGFTYEGTFRKHMVVKGRTRDTAWFAITDDEWPPIRAGFESWLAPTNFDPDGRQLQALGALVAAARGTQPPQT